MRNLAPIGLAALLIAASCWFQVGGGGFEGVGQHSGVAWRAFKR